MSREKLPYHLVRDIKLTFKVNLQEKNEIDSAMERLKPESLSALIRDAIEFYLHNY